MVSLGCSRNGTPFLFLFINYLKGGKEEFAEW